jgi:hypothetical protein
MVPRRRCSLFHCKSPLTLSLPARISLDLHLQTLRPRPTGNPEKMAAALPAWERELFSPSPSPIRVPIHRTSLSLDVSQYCVFSSSPASPLASSCQGVPLERIRSRRLVPDSGGTPSPPSCRAFESEHALTLEGQLHKPCQAQYLQERECLLGCVVRLLLCDLPCSGLPCLGRPIEKHMTGTCTSHVFPT